MITHTKLAFLFALIVLSASSAMSEAALLSISRFKIKHWVEKKKFGAIYVQKLKNNPARLLTTLLIANNLVNTAAASLITAMSLELFQNNALAIATGVATFLILVFGDILPKSIGVNNNELLAPLMAPAVWYLSYAFFPLTKLLEYAINTINRLFGTKKISIISREELKSMVKYSEEQGSIKDIEKKMIHRIFDFDNTTVSDVMTRRKNIVSVGSDMIIKDVLQLPNAKMYSRFPVYEKNKDNIVGILYLKDMMKFVKDSKLDAPVKQIMRKPFFVFGHRKVDAMLKMFQNRKEHMAIVIDDKAHVIGVVTIENILEEIVGEIIDESDRINPSIEQVSKNEWIANGTADVEEVNAKTGLTIKGSDYDSLDSFIFSTLGRPPKEGEEITYQSYKIILEEVQGRKVLRAKIVKL